MGSACSHWTQPEGETPAKWFYQGWNDARGRCISCELRSVRSPACSTSCLNKLRGRCVVSRMQVGICVSYAVDFSAVENEIAVFESYSEHPGNACLKNDFKFFCEELTVLYDRWWHKCFNFATVARKFGMSAHTVLNCTSEVKEKRKPAVIRKTSPNTKANPRQTA